MKAYGTYTRKEVLGMMALPCNPDLLKIRASSSYKGVVCKKAGQEEGNPRQHQC